MTADTPQAATEALASLVAAVERVVTGGPTTDYSLDVTIYLGADYRRLASYESSD